MIRRIRYAAMCFVVGSMLGLAPMHARSAVTLIDSFTDGSIQITSSGALVDNYQTGLDGVLGGTRYVYVQRTSPGGQVALGVNTPFAGLTAFFSTAVGNGIGGISWGRFDPLNANLSSGGVVFGFRLGEFWADDPGLTGFISLTVYSDSGNDTVTYAISDFINRPQWFHEDFDNSVNFANVSRLDLDFFGFTALGPDLEFTTFNTVSALPEPGTMAMMFMAGGLLMVVRRRYVRREAEPQDEAVEPPLEPSKTNIYYQARNAA